jgi:hypothetical protein
MPDDVPWQDWIVSRGVLDNVSGSFKRDSPPYNRHNHDAFSAASQLQLPYTMTNTGDVPSGGRKLALNADVIADILAVTHAMPSWKACQMEGTSWSGTAEENIEKYKSSIGTAED